MRPISPVPSPPAASYCWLLLSSTALIPGHQQPTGAIKHILIALLSFSELQIETEASTFRPSVDRLLIESVPEPQTFANLIFDSGVATLIHAMDQLSMKIAAQIASD